MQGVTLPYLISFEIMDYPLFRSDISWPFQDGINLLLGVNGVGKTTTIRAIAFGIVGGLALNKKSNYFRSRLPEKTQGVIPRVQVAFTVGIEEFTVTRRLDTLQFMKFTYREANGETYTGTQEREYIDTLTQSTGIPTLFELDFLVKHLLIREEEAEATLWNVEEHSRVLRLLFNSGEFERKYAKLQKTVKDAHIRLSQVANTLAYARSALDGFRQKWFGSSSPFNAEEPARLRNQRDELTHQAIHAQTELDELLPALEEAHRHLDHAFNQKVELEQQSDRIEDRVTQLESAFHSSLYARYTPVRMALRKLDQHHVCMFCDRPVPEHLRISLVKTYSAESECLFCGQAADACPPEAPRAPELEEVITYRKRVKKALLEADLQIKEAKATLDPLARRETELRTEILRLRERLNSVERRLSELSGVAPGWVESEEARLQASVHALERQAADAREALNRAQDEIGPLRSLERETLRSLADRFRKTFSRYVTKYLGEEGSVEVQVKQNPGDRSEYAWYTPIVAGIPRGSANEVSKSQAVLLDYAFRMTVLDLYRELTGQSSFFILETSEGVLDAAYVKRIGTLLGDFAMDSGHLLVLVNNLSRSDFLNFIFHRIPRDQRVGTTLNFLKIGRLSSVQLEGEEAYKHVGQDVFGPSFSTI